MSRLPKPHDSFVLQYHPVYVEKHDWTEYGF